MRTRVTCHCGAIELQVTLTEPLTSARRCDCSFCRRRGAAVVSAKLDDLEIIKGVNNLALYEFGSKTAKHYFCKTCGVYTHHQRRFDPTQIGVNLGGIEGVNPSDFGHIPYFDGVNHPSDKV